MYKPRCHIPRLTAIALIFVLTSSSVFAGAKIFHSVVRQPNGFTLISGTYEGDNNNNSDPFVVQIFSSGDECVRLEMVFQTADMEMTLISPTGTIWQNDDGDVDTYPLLKVITNVRGWYPLVVSHYSGDSIMSDFDLQYGRFPSSSSQCNDPTPPLGLAVASAKEGVITHGRQENSLDPSENE